MPTTTTRKTAAAAPRKRAARKAPTPPAPEPRPAGSGSTAGETRVRHLRVSIVLWARASARAAREGVGMSELIRGWLRAYADGDNPTP